MNLKERLKIFTNSIRRLVTNPYISKRIKLQLIKDFLRFSFKTSCWHYVKFSRSYFNFKKEKILSYNIELESYMDFMDQFIDIFVDFVYFCPLRSKEPHIIDCGSNIGISIIFFKYMFPKASIIAFEPDPTMFILLKRNCEQNKLKKIKIINSGLYSKNGFTSFYSFDKESDNGTLGSTFLEHNDYRRARIKVSVTKLSDHIKNKVDILKVDIEGSEEVVMGEIRKKLHLVNNIIMEYHAFAEINKQNKLSKIIKYLESNFYFFLNENDGQILPTFDHHLVILKAKNKNNL